MPMAEFIFHIYMNGNMYVTVELANNMNNTSISMHQRILLSRPEALFINVIYYDNKFSNDDNL